MCKNRSLLCVRVYEETLMFYSNKKRVDVRLFCPILFEWVRLYRMAGQLSVGNVQELLTPQSTEYKQKLLIFQPS